MDLGLKSSDLSLAILYLMCNYQVPDVEQRYLDISKLLYIFCNLFFISLVTNALISKRFGMVIFYFSRMVLYSRQKMLMKLVRKCHTKMAASAP